MWGTKLAPERTPAAPWELQQRWRWAGVDRLRLMATCVGQVGRHSLRCGTQGENLEMKDAPVTVYVSHLVVCPNEHQKPFRFSDKAACCSVPPSALSRRVHAVPSAEQQLTPQKKKLLPLPKVME